MQKTKFNYKINVTFLNENYKYFMNLFYILKEFNYLKQCNIEKEFFTPNHYYIYLTIYTDDYLNIDFLHKYNADQLTITRNPLPVDLSQLSTRL